MEARIYYFCIFYFFNVIINNIEKVGTLCFFTKKAVMWVVWFYRNKELKRFWLIFFVNLMIKEIIDLYLTKYLIFNFNFLISLFSTTLIYLLIGIISIKIYDLYKQDIFWIEKLKNKQLSKNKIKDGNPLIKFILKRNKTNKFFLGLLLFFKNPALMVIYFRDNHSQYNGFAGKNIILYFAGYLLIMNLYWNLMVYFSISIWKILWGFLKQIY